MLKGIDISKWQNGIDLGSIQTDFVICKATEGVGYTDSTCDKYYQKAKSLDKKLGVYHFARPDLGNSGKTEADYFLKETKGYWKEALLILDWEPQGNSISNVSWAKEWLDRVYEVTGVKPLIYMSASVMCSYDWSSVANADYGLWVANYYTNDGNAHEECFNKYPVKYWKFYALWQYSSKGRLSGYNGNLDVNYFSGDLAAWDKYARGDSSIKTSQSTTKPATNNSSYLYADYNGTSIVDALKGIGVDSTFNHRKQLASLNGISNYTGTPDQNTQLLNLLKQGKLKASGTSNANTSSTSNTSNTTYLRANYNGSSFVDALKEIGVDSSFSYRSKLAYANGIRNYKGSPVQNTALLNLLKQGKLKKV